MNARPSFTPGQHLPNSTAVIPAGGTGTRLWPLSRAQHLVTPGTTPTRPATGFGYIEVGPPLGLTGAPEARHVEVFREKPAADLAAAYLRGGRHLWNAGIFVVGAVVLLDLLAASDSEMASLLRAIAQCPESLEAQWRGMPSIAIDHAVAEPAGRNRRVAVVPAECAWHDVGDFASLAGRASPHGSHPWVRVLGDEDVVMAPDSTGLIAPHGDRMVVSLGLQEVIAIDTPDALLLTSPDRAQQVGAIVNLLRDMAGEDLI
ncbi:sugar phosphate nucleotidyltransferase [Serinicoccus chungangensis]|uniref:sugar phosphate nucleotidyltransferase n=1 Tax=Serinicoccus chungangensis TaxID=767452 RepID=UPI00111A3B4E|nr:sugar phosphate nucleotidyltransferase [Serinicoccus chungangensis]